MCSIAHSCLSAVLWAVAHQAPLSMEISRQECWSGLPPPTPGDLPDPGIEPTVLGLPHWQADSLPRCQPVSPRNSFSASICIFVLLLFLFISRHTFISFKTSYRFFFFLRFSQLTFQKPLHFSYFPLDSSSRGFAMDFHFCQRYFFKVLKN